MTNYFTPEDSQDFSTSKKRTVRPAKMIHQPSAATMSFVFGYSAALEIIKTIGVGSVKVLLN